MPERLGENFKNVGRKSTENNIAKLKDNGMFKRVGPDKGGYWEIIKLKK